MVYDLIMESGEYALIIRGSRMKEYAVVNGLDKAKGSWAWTCTYYNFGEFSVLSQAEALAMALDYFRSKTEDNGVMRMEINTTIDKEDVRRSLQVLIDNGIEEDEAGVVLNAIGYTLLGVELDVEGM